MHMTAHQLEAWTMLRASTDADTGDVARLHSDDGDDLRVEHLRGVPVWLA